jgi:hypothetical protein
MPFPSVLAVGSISFLLRLFLRNNSRVIAPMIKRTPIVTPRPTPALAPVLRDVLLFSFVLAIAVDEVADVESVVELLPAEILVLLDELEVAVGMKS